MHTLFSSNLSQSYHIAITLKKKIHFFQLEFYTWLTLGTANVYKNNFSVQACPSLSIKAVFSPFKCLYSSKHPKICPYLSRDQIILKYHPLLVQEKSRLVQSFPEKEINFHIMANQGQTYCLLSTFNYCVAWVPTQQAEVAGNWWFIDWK